MAFGKLIVPPVERILIRPSASLATPPPRPAPMRGASTTSRYTKATASTTATTTPSLTSPSTSPTASRSTPPSSRAAPTRRRGPYRTTRTAAGASPAACWRTRCSTTT
jgi:hypothetical protein